MSRNLTVVSMALRRIQEEGNEGNFVIFFSDQARNYYIQFAGEPGSSVLYAEAVGNEVLAPADCLGQAQVAHLLLLGWNPPTHAPNFYRRWEARNDQERFQIAREVLRTFCEVYGFTDEETISVELNLGE